MSRQQDAQKVVFQLQKLIQKLKLDVIRGASEKPEGKGEVPWEQIRDMLLDTYNTLARACEMTVQPVEFVFRCQRCYAHVYSKYQERCSCLAEFVFCTSCNLWHNNYHSLPGGKGKTCHGEPARVELRPCEGQLIAEKLVVSTI